VKKAFIPLLFYEGPEKMKGKMKNGLQMQSKNEIMLRRYAL
jgi:hypothetical protein